MNEDSKKDIAFLISDNRRAIKNPLAKEAFKRNPNIISQDTEKSKQEIQQILPLLENHFRELLPFIKDLKGYVSDITEETYICAIYLLLSHASQDWISLFNLAKIGDYGSFAFIRLIKEVTALSDLFTLDFTKKEKKNIEKWFSGGIIGHAICREARNEFVGKDGMVSDDKMKKMDTKIYQMESLVVHGSYVTMLESVSPFTEEFDFDGRTQYFRTSKGLLYAKGTMDAMNITLKFVYGFIIKDNRKYKQLDDILVKYGNIG